jgi:hypothetical protein
MDPETLGLLASMSIEGQNVRTRPRMKKILEAASVGSSTHHAHSLP